MLCFACTLRNVPAEQAASLLLKDVYGFTLAEAAEALGATFGQVKNWVQSARATMEQRYAQSCALGTHGGVCSKCLDVDEYFRAGRGDPLAGTKKDVRARLQILREDRARPLGRWHHQMMKVVDDILR